jgi:hypothetical protein
LTDLEAQAILPASWLVQDLLLEETLGIVAAPGESGKTVMMLGMGLCIASGTPWNGHTVKQGAVAYLSAEGRQGFGKRIRAWKRHHALAEEDSLPLYPLLEAVPLLDQERQTALHAALRTLPSPLRLVVIDTLSQSTTGVDENTAAMAAALAAADRIKSTFCCTVVVVHHSTKDGSKMRGHSSLRDNVDTQILLVKDEHTNTVTVTCGKQRDEDHFAPFTVQFKKVLLGANGTISSAVLTPVNAPANATKQRTTALPANQQQALEALASCKQGATSTEWQAATGLDKVRFQEARKALVSQGLVAGGGGKGVKYVLTDQSRFVLKDQK